MLKIFKSLKIIAVILVSFALAGIIIVASLNNASVVKNIRPMVSKHPERVSELYFTDYAAIPKKLEVNHLYQVGFSVTNREYRRKAYTYEAVMVEGDIASIIATKEFSLNNKQVANQQIQFKPTKANAQIGLIIRLLRGKQEIRFKART